MIEYVHKFIARSGVPAPQRRTRAVVVRSHLLRLMQQLPMTAALVYGPNLDVLAWNPLAAALLVDFADIAPERRNYVRLLFTHPSFRALFAD